MKYFSEPFNLDSNNDLLASHSEQWLHYGTHLYPSLTINQKSFRGRLTPRNVFEAICSSFVNTPSKCLNWEKMEGIKFKG